MIGKLWRWSSVDSLASALWEEVPSRLIWLQPGSVDTAIFTSGTLLPALSRKSCMSTVTILCCPSAMTDDCDRGAWAVSNDVSLTGVAARARFPLIAPLGWVGSTVTEAAPSVGTANCNPIGSYRTSMRPPLTTKLRTRASPSDGDGVPLAMMPPSSADTRRRD